MHEKILKDTGSKRQKIIQTMRPCSEMQIFGRFIVPMHGENVRCALLVGVQ
jgi:hypothetical protein